MPAHQRSLRITDAYRTRLIAFTTRTVREAERTWPRIENFDESLWPEITERSVTRAQTEAARLSAAYLTAFISSELGRRVAVVAVDTTAYAGLTRGGDPIRKLLDNQMVGVRADMAKGHSPDEALKRGLNRATRNLDLEIMETSRRALSEMMQSDDRIEGWQRSVKGTCGACLGDIAVEVSIQLPSIPLRTHPNCACVCSPVLVGVPQTIPLLTGAERLREMTDAEQDESFGALAAARLRLGEIGLQDLVGDSHLDSGDDFISQRPVGAN